MTRPALDQALLQGGVRPTTVAVPTYDRSALRTGIVHVGVGGFDRAHQAVYLDELMNAGRVMDWAICGVGVLPSDRRMAEVMTAQDCLYTVVVRTWPGAPTARVVGSMTEYLFAPDDPEAVVEQMADEDVRIVSLTVTEGGYNLDPLTAALDLREPRVRADLRGDRPPTTMYALVTEALLRRRARRIAPFAVLSCDNVKHNGDVARRSICGYAQAVDPDLAGWIREQVSFPDSMVTGSLR
jgi:mannitol 2-dehydrogenase